MPCLVVNVRFEVVGSALLLVLLIRLALLAASIRLLVRTIQHQLLLFLQILVLFVLVLLRVFIVGLSLVWILLSIKSWKAVMERIKLDR